MKGLEPEIQSLITRHKAELSRLQALHEKEVADTEERCEMRTRKQIHDVRIELEKEKEDACNKTRDTTRNK